MAKQYFVSFLSGSASVARWHDADNGPFQSFNEAETFALTEMNDYPYNPDTGGIQAFHIKCE